MLLADLRFGLRMMRKHPLSTAVAILTLALGIGANSAIFSVVYSVLLRPLPYRDPARIAVFFEVNPKGDPFLLSPPNFKDWMTANQTFDSLAAARPAPVVLTSEGLPEKVESVAVTPSMFPLLGAAAAIGRTFTADEGEPGRNRSVLLSHGLWLRRFGGNPDARGKKLVIDGVPHEIVGVMPAGFRLLDLPGELWTPYAFDAKELEGRGLHTLTAVGRLKPGMPFDAGERSVQSAARDLAQRYPDINGGWTAKAVSLAEHVTGNIRATLLTLFGAVAFVLLIACSNAANLLLARSGARKKEVAIRVSLGASPWALVRQMLCESVLTALCGGLLGLAIAYLGVRALALLRPAGIPRIDEIAIDGGVLLFTLVVSLLTGVLFGLAPALTSLKYDLHTALKTSGRSANLSPASRRIRAALVIAEVSLSVLLMTGAALLARSFVNLQRVDPGFRSDHVLTMNLSVPESSYKGQDVARFHKRLVERVRGLPGVREAGIVRDAPLSGGKPTLNFDIESQAVVASGQQPRGGFRAAGPGYFEAMGIRLVKGRFFERSDSEGTEPVAVINEAMAKRYFADRDPLGRRLRAGFDGSQWCRIVGVSGNTRHAALDADAQPEIFYHFEQIFPPMMNFVEGKMTLVLRTDSDPAPLTSAVRGELRGLDPSLAVFNVKTMDDLLDGAVAQPRFRTALLGVFAAVALALAAIGLYGVVSFTVSQRTNEVGLRMALGASAGEVVWLIVGGGMRLALAGVAVGLVFALFLARVLAAFLFGVEPIDPAAFSAAAAVLLLVTFLASYLPARRAAKVDPAAALRE